MKTLESFIENIFIIGGLGVILFTAYHLFIVNPLI
jgi:hypothetical protein